MKTIYPRIERGLFNRIKHYCDENGLKVKTFIEYMLEQAVTNHHIDEEVANVVGVRVNISDETYEEIKSYFEGGNRSNVINAFIKSEFIRQLTEDK